MHVEVSYNAWHIPELACVLYDKHGRRRQFRVPLLEKSVLLSQRTDLLAAIGEANTERNVSHVGGEERGSRERTHRSHLQTLLVTSCASSGSPVHASAEASERWRRAVDSITEGVATTLAAQTAARVVDIAGGERVMVVVGAVKLRL
jgi:hypothetical protein